jgi:Ca2+-binding RTX toxin-like protein
MFTATWWGIGYNYGSLNIAGDSTKYVVNWGDGSRDVIRTDQDDDGDPFATTEYGHGYASDGTYDVSILQSQAGLPPIRLKAFMYARETDDITIGGSQLDDMIYAGSGNDTLSGARGRDTINGGEGNDTVRGNQGDDFLLGNLGQDFIRGDAGDDLIGGEEGDDRILGGDGNDSLYGDEGADEVQGGDGNDYVSGGAGVDRLWGNAGSDVFMFAPIDGERRDTDRDQVVDFVRGQDHIAIWDWIDDPAAVQFIGDAAFSGSGAPEIRIAAGNGGMLVQGDADGNGVFDFTLKVNGVAALDGTDFYF